MVENKEKQEDMDDWRVPFYFGIGLEVFIVLAFILNYNVEKNLSNILVFSGLTIFCFCLSYFGGWKKGHKKETKEEVKNE